MTDIKLPSTFKLKRIHTVLILGGSILGLAFGAGAQVALSKATLVSHEQRIAATELAAFKAADAVKELAAKTAEHNARRDQQLDDIDRATTRIEAKLDRLSRK
jgi:hypothetical protein